MTDHPDLSAIRRSLTVALQDNPAGAGTHFSLAELASERYGIADRDEARRLVGALLREMEDTNEVVLLPAEQWDHSGDQRVRLRR